MRIEAEVRGDVCILRLKGRFVTGSNGACVRAQEQLEAAGYCKVVADCREAGNLDAAGAGWIAGLYRSLANSGGQLVLANVNPRIREVLQITRLNDFIPIFDDEEAAFATLSDRERAACA